MKVDSLLDPQFFINYIWIVYVFFLLIIAVATFSLFFNWHKYSGSRSYSFRLGQTVYLVGIILLALIATSFYLSI